MKKAALIIALALCGAVHAKVSSTVGVDAKIEGVFISGEEVHAAPRHELRDPVVLRILNKEQVKGGYRYDFQVEGHAPATYDLRDYLLRTNGEKIAGGEPIEFEVRTVLPEGDSELSKLATQTPERIGGYRKVMIGLGGAWGIIGLGLLGVVAVRKFREREASLKNDLQVDRLRELVERAASNELGVEQKAQLERMILGHWTRLHPELQALSVADALIQLRRLEGPAKLLESLERWMHDRSNNNVADAQRVLREYELVLDVQFGKGGGI